MSTEPVKSRVALFIDFWNFTLNMKKLDESFLIDWFKIPSAFIQYLQGRRLDGLSDALEYAGCEVVGSYSPHEVSLWNWSRTTLQKINGLTSTFLPRQKMEQGPVCTGAEHHEVPSCPQCGKPMLGYKDSCDADAEKGLAEQLRRCPVGILRQGFYPRNKFPARPQQEMCSGRLSRFRL